MVDSNADASRSGDGMEDSGYVLDEGVEEILVEGAGIDAVNGVYQRNGEFNDSPRYTKLGHWNEEPREFWLFCCKLMFDKSPWYISIPDGSEPGTYRDIDFYSSVEISENDPPYSPTLTWELASAGRDPVPSVTRKEGLAISTIPIAKPIGLAYANMLFSEDFSDVKFVCSDGQVIPAHCCILASASPYFKAAFSGPWKSNESGVHKTTHPANIIRAMLTMIYTGNTKSELLAQEPLAFLSVASEYNLPWLKRLAELQVTYSSLDPSCLKDVWQAGRLYDGALLKNLCIEYAKKNALLVLATGNITHLQTEDPPSWKEFTEALTVPVEEENSSRAEENS